MGSVGDRKAPWHSRLVIHLILLTGAAFFVLPLVWMIATSLKPLDQTLHKPESITTAFFATGYWTKIGGKEYEVTLVRAIDPTSEGTQRIVRPKPYGKGVEPFRAGELTLPFGPKVWQGSPSFTDDELKQMNAPVTVDRTVLADKANTYDPATGELTLKSGRKVPVEVVRTISKADEHPVLRLLADYLEAFKVTKAANGSKDRQVRLEYKLEPGKAETTTGADGLADYLHRAMEAGRACESQLAKQHVRKDAREEVTRQIRDYFRARRAKEKALLEAVGQSGKRATVQLIEKYADFRSSAEANLMQDLRKELGFWLVREWRPIDTDTKGMSSPFVNVERAWDIVPRSDIRTGPKIIPENYPVALRRVHFARSLGNTLMVCALTVCGAVVSSVIVAYGFAFLRFPGRNGLFALTLMTIMVPFVVTMIPVYLMYRDLGWVGTYKPLWVATWFGNAFFIFLLRQFFLGIPTDLLDAARIDGCSELEILWNVVVPLSRPVIAMVALFTFLGTWKDFLGPLIYLNHESQFTLSLALQAFSSEHGGTPWHLLMAASTVFSLPLIVLFFFAMKTFIRSVAMTGLKG